jgi:hypothetical protein
MNEPTSRETLLFREFHKLMSLLSLPQRDASCLHAKKHYKTVTVKQWQEMANPIKHNFNKFNVAAAKVKLRQRVIRERCRNAGGLRRK